MCVLQESEERRTALLDHLAQKYPTHADAIRSPGGWIYVSNAVHSISLLFVLCSIVLHCHFGLSIRFPVDFLEHQPPALAIAIFGPSNWNDMMDALHGCQIRLLL